MPKPKRMNTKTISAIAIFVLLFGVVSSSLMDDAFAAYSTSKPSEKKKTDTKKTDAKTTAKTTETKVSIAKGTATPGCEAKKGCYKPFEAKVKTGSKVTWKNDDKAAHTVTSGKDATADGTFDSGMIAPGKTFSYAFSKAGKFDYYCMVHPWMTGKVTVS